MRRPPFPFLFPGLSDELLGSMAISLNTDEEMLATRPVEFRGDQDACGIVGGIPCIVGTTRSPAAIKQVPENLLS